MVRDGPDRVKGVSKDGAIAALSDGIVSVSVDSTRSQHRNRQLARQRLAELLVDATKRPRPRRTTRVPRGARQRRRKAKQRRSETKRLRRRPDVD